MTKGKNFPGNLVTVDQLKTIDTTEIPDGLPFIVDNTWYVLSYLYSPEGNRLDEIVSEYNGTFIPVPFKVGSGVISSSTINANTTTTNIDLSTTSNIIYINLQSNTTLNFTNSRKYREYTIVLEFNDYKVTNLFNIARWNIGSEELINSFNPLLIFKLSRVDVLNASILWYGDYFSYKEKKTLLQIVPENDFAYFENVNNNVNYYGGTNDRVKLEIPTELTIPYKQNYDLSTNTTFQLYVDYVINSYSSTYVQIFGFWGSEDVFRVRINQNTIVYQYRNFTYTYTYGSNFISNRRYQIEVVKYPTTVQNNNLSIRIRDTVTGLFLTANTFTQPLSAALTGNLNHIPFTFQDGIVEVDTLYKLLWTTSTDFELIQSRNFTTYDFNFLFNHRSYNKREYKRQSDIVYYAPSETDFADSSTNNFTPVVSGTPIFNSGLVNLSNSSISYVKNSSLNLNNVDFSISFYVKFLTPSDQGTVISIWSPSSKQLIVGITESFLIIRFRATLNIITLDVNIESLKVDSDLHYVEVVRSGLQYIVFIDGIPVKTLLYSDSTMNFSTADLRIGKILIPDNDLPVSALSFNGLLKDLKIARSSPNVTSYLTVQPRDANPVATALWKFYVSSEELVSNLMYTNITSGSFLESLNNRNVLNTTAHFEVAGSNFDFGSDNLTIEGYITRPSGNTTGTLVFLSNILHFGVNNLKLNLTLTNIAVNITSTSDISSGIRTHVAYVRFGNVHTLYINGTSEATATVSGSINSTPITVPFGVKRTNIDDNSPATNNTSSYPGKSLIIVDSLSVLPFAKYISNFTPEVEI